MKVALLIICIAGLLTAVGFLINDLIDLHRIHKLQEFMWQFHEDTENQILEYCKKEGITEEEFIKRIEDQLKEL